jgi:flavin reductase (DIM6/NTAB) family NADH-FMN oxidoreductase RutF
MHKVVDLKVMYFGAPVVLIGTRNPDGSPNLAPISSAFWLGNACVIGMGNTAQTSGNLRRERECVLNLPSSAMVDVVDRLALLTGSATLSPRRIERGYRYEPDKFGTAGLTPVAGDLVAAPRAAECPIQLECRLVDSHPIDDGTVSAHHLEVIRCHIDEEIVIPGTHYVDPIGWDPLIMKFCEFFGEGRNIHPSRLAAGWKMPHGAALAG